MKLVITVLFLFLGITTWAQQAWTQKKGEGIFILGTSFFTYNKVHMGLKDHREIQRAISETILSSYGEYGITNKLTLVFNIPFHFTGSGNRIGASAPVIEKGNLNAFGNLSSGLTYNVLTKKNLVLSSKLSATANTSTYQNHTGLRTGYNTWTFTPTILGGYSRKRLFTSVALGISLMGNNYADRVLLNGQIGSKLTKSNNLIIIFAVSSSNILGKINENTSQALDKNAWHTALYMNKQAFVAGALKLGYNFLDRWFGWFAISGGTATNIGQNFVYAASLGYQLKK